MLLIANRLAGSVSVWMIFSKNRKLTAKNAKAAKTQSINENTPGSPRASRSDMYL